MKLRNGFISNSSSSSFIIAFPKNTPIPLKDIETWLGGYTKEISSEIMDYVGFIFWKSQYFNNEGYERDPNEEGIDYDYHVCNAPWEVIRNRECWRCPGFIDHTNIDSACSTCKYHSVEKRISRNDDYWTAKDALNSEAALNWLQKHKDMKIIYLDIDDNNPPEGVPYNIADIITSRAELLFINPENVYCLGGKN